MRCQSPKCVSSSAVYNLVFLSLTKLTTAGKGRHIDVSGHATILECFFLLEGETLTVAITQ